MLAGVTIKYLVIRSALSSRTCFQRLSLLCSLRCGTLSFSKLCFVLLLETEVGILHIVISIIVDNYGGRYF